MTPTRNGNPNGSDARQAAYQAWKACRKERKQWGDYTPVFQALENFLIGADFVDLPHRVLQLALQSSWGKHSDHCVNADGDPHTQADFARILSTEEKRVDRRRIHECIQMWRDAGVLRIEDDGRILPIWAPKAWLAKRPRPERRPGAYRAWLRANRPDQADEREELVAKLNELDLRNIPDYRASRAADLSGHSGQTEKVRPECADNVSGSLRTTKKAILLISGDLAKEQGPILSTESSQGAAAAKVPDTAPPPPVANANGNSQAEADIATVLQAFRDFGIGDRRIAIETLQECRRRPAGRDCTGEEVARQVRKRAPEAIQKKHPKEHPAAWLKTAAAAAFDDENCKAAAAPARNYKYV